MSSHIPRREPSKTSMLDSEITMFDLDKRETESPEREAFREAFKQLTRILRDSDDLSQMVIGNSINMANSSFLQTHTSVAAFMRLPEDEKAAYIHTLAAAEDELHEGDPESALGFGLFRMWISALISEDEELIKAFSGELVYFGEKGDLTQYFR